jgi:hypothetical protein
LGGGERGAISSFSSTFSRRAGDDFLKLAERIRVMLLSVGGELGVAPDRKLSTDFELPVELALRDVGLPFALEGDKAPLEELSAL